MDAGRTELAAYPQNMGNADREWANLDDDEGNRFHAMWSRSGKRLIVTVMAPPPGVGPGWEPARGTKLHALALEEPGTAPSPGTTGRAARAVTHDA